MAKPRVFTHSGTQAGVYHLVSRIVDRQFLFGDAEKEAFGRMMRAFAAFHQVEILTYCLMSNHFHLLVRVPHRPAGFDLPLGEVLARWQDAVGDAWNRGLTRQFAAWQENGSEAAVEEWRQRMVGRMFSLTEFMKALKQRYTQWYNRRSGRRGTLWEGRYKSVIVEDEASALRTMATYIDLNPVRAGIVSDPGDYRWSGYAEAMSGNATAQEGIARITGTTAERTQGAFPNQHPHPAAAASTQGSPAPPNTVAAAPPETDSPAATAHPDNPHTPPTDPAFRESPIAPASETPAQRRRRHLRALVHYREMLGVAGRPRQNAAGATIRRGLSEKVQARLASGRGVKREQLLRRVRHFTDGVILGSRAFIDQWFQANRPWFSGRSAETRQTGARPISKDWKHLYNLRQLQG